MSLPKQFFDSHSVRLTSSHLTYAILRHNAKLTVNYLCTGNAVNSGHELEYLMEHAKERIVDNAHKVAVEGASQVLAIARSWDLGMKTELIKKGFKLELTDE